MSKNKAMRGLTTEYLFIGIQVFLCECHCLSTFFDGHFLLPGQIADAVSKMIYDGVITRAWHNQPFSAMMTKP
ncbi:hypothetical protein, partial [uncultured Duncaniella sp.]|uniref:hypothetical protein n=1 Tax=uncultured Duncaniella sp. TaxID=2768039 RepID=UPI002608FFAC